MEGKEMEFKVTLKMGNAAMQTGDDIARAMRKLAGYFEGSSGTFDQGEFRAIHDDNGNKIGEWRVD
jgi:hypothetical protein